VSVTHNSCFRKNRCTRTQSRHAVRERRSKARNSMVGWKIFAAATTAAAVGAVLPPPVANGAAQVRIALKLTRFRRSLIWIYRTFW
jgi:hypothetical protein